MELIRDSAEKIAINNEKIELDIEASAPLIPRFTYRIKAFNGTINHTFKGEYGLPKYIRKIIEKMPIPSDDNNIVPFKKYDIHTIKAMLKLHDEYEQDKQFKSTFDTFEYWELEDLAHLLDSIEWNEAHQYIEHLFANKKEEMKYIYEVNQKRHAFVVLMV